MVIKHTIIHNTHIIIIQGFTKCYAAYYYRRTDNLKYLKGIKCTFMFHFYLGEILGDQKVLSELVTISDHSN